MEKNNGSYIIGSDEFIPVRTLKDQPLPTFTIHGPCRVKVIGRISSEVILVEFEKRGRRIVDAPDIENAVQKE